MTLVQICIAILVFAAIYAIGQIKVNHREEKRKRDYKPSEGLKGCIEATARLKEPKAGALITDEITGISNLMRGIKRVEYRDFPAMNDEYTLYEYNGNLKGAKA
jgi:hypothetical protein